MTAIAWRSIPSQVIVGSSDRLFPLEFMQRLSRERLGIEPAVIDAGHLIALARPGELVKEINAAIAIHITDGSSRAAPD